MAIGVIAKTLKGSEEKVASDLEELINKEGINYLKVDHSRILIESGDPDSLGPIYEYSILITYKK